jgi:pyruvate/2-oxoglutarate/acetoin dehydrogenase E1 component
MDTMIGSVSKTHRAVIVDEGWQTGSLAAEIGMQIAEKAFYELDAPLARVCSEEVPIPYARTLNRRRSRRPRQSWARPRALRRR